MISVDYKGRGEKLLRIDIEFDTNRSDNKKIKKLVITGDFFAYPEEVIQKIEEELVGVDAGRKAITKKVRDILRREKAEFIGLSPESVAEAIMKAESSVNTADS